MPTTVVCHSEVLEDLKQVDGDKAALMAQYAKRMGEIQTAYGGSIGDIPYDSEHEYWKLQAKLRIIHRLIVEGA